MKQLRIGPIYVLAMFCLLASAAGQLLWVRQLFWTEHARLQRELEDQISTVAEQTIYARLLPQPVPQTPYRAFFLSPGWRQLRAAFDNLDFPKLGKNNASSIAEDSMYVTLGFSLRSKPATGKVTRHSYNSYVATLTPQRLAQIDRQSLGHLRPALDSLLRTQHVGSAAGYRIFEVAGHRYLGGGGPAPGRIGYVSRPYAYNDLHLRTCQLVVPSLLGAVLYRLRYSLASAGLLLLLTGATFGALLRLVRSQRRYAEARIAFTSNMTHELKTPVATVALALESITKFHLSQNPAKLQEYLAIGQHELRRLTQLLDNVLALDQAENGPTALRPELYDVQEGLQQAIAALRPQFAQQHGVLTFQPSPEPCFVLGDPVHLTNVCYNLLENALKYGGPGVQVQLACIIDGQQVRLSVQDNGPGIAKAYHAKVFERFFRVPGPANVHAVKGTGLGLHYVRQIVAQHHGTIVLRSAPGAGSRFTITLPAA